MDQIKLIAAYHKGLAIPELETEVNEWLEKNSDKEIINISIISFPHDPRDPERLGSGWIIMIRYTALTTAGVNFAAP